MAQLIEGEIRCGIHSGQQHSNFEDYVEPEGKQIVAAVGEGVASPSPPPPAPPPAHARAHRR